MPRTIRLAAISLSTLDGMVECNYSRPARRKSDPMTPDNLKLLLPAVVFMILMGVIFWSAVIRPQARGARKHDELIKGLQVGDKIVTAGGMHGTVVKVTDDSFVLEIAPEVRVTFDRRAVRKRLD
jgi:preprotein translocase subunit YajC